MAGDAVQNSGLHGVKTAGMSFQLILAASPAIALQLQGLIQHAEALVPC